MKFIKKSGISIFYGKSVGDRRQRKQEIRLGGNQEEGKKRGSDEEELREEEQVRRLPVILLLMKLPGWILTSFIEFKWKLPIVTVVRSGFIFWL